MLSIFRCWLFTVSAVFCYPRVFVSQIRCKHIKMQTCLSLVSASFVNHIFVQTKQATIFSDYLTDNLHSLSREDKYCTGTDTEFCFSLE